MSTDNLFLQQPGLAPNISSSTLRHSSPKFSFSHAKRFFQEKTLKPSSIIHLPSTKMNRTTTQGFGKKTIFQWKHQEINAKQIPPPDKYEIRTVPGKDALKKSFGISFDNYSLVYLPHSKDIVPEVAKQLPGPGKYEPKQQDSRYPVSLKGKGKAFNESKDWGFPAPDKYSPKFYLIDKSRYSIVSQGIGSKGDPFRSNSITPGPGRYNITSGFSRKLAKINKHLTTSVEISN